jgi:hypothetical protein
MNSPREAILEWWKLVRVGGHIFFIVPDEDLYEQGVFPSRFNSDHKATFTISKRESWSPVSINVLDLASSLPGGQVVSLQLQDHGYDRRLYRHDYAGPNFFVRKIIKLHGIIYYRTRIAITALRNLQANAYTIDQTATHGAVAQIQCIVKKVE